MDSKHISTNTQVLETETTTVRGIVVSGIKISHGIF